MIVTCSSCSNRFTLNDSLLPPEGRHVRCTVCYYTWKQLPEKSSSKVPPLISLDNSPDFIPPRAFPKKRFRWTGFVLFLAILAILLNIIVFGRDTIVETWPEAEKGYSLLGLSTTVPGVGLVISNITPRLNANGEIEMLVVEGYVTNTSHDVREFSSLKINIIGEKGSPKTRQILDHWEHYLPKSSLAPGEFIHFETAPRPKIAGGEVVTVEF
jgi:predicted Zn finger-like uncharacterized protein